jgi:shikimate dehydrogenase
VFEVYRTLVTGSTRVLGVMGYPIKHSLSPQMHSVAIRHMGLDYCYVPFLVHPHDLHGAVKAIVHLGIVGVNVTIPHKTTVIPYLDELSLEAQLLGAVNTICNRDGILYGDNTDGKGFIMSLQRDAHTEPGDKKILILGAGGAARGVGITLACHRPAQVVVAARRLEQALQLVNDMRQVDPKGTYIVSTLGHGDLEKHICDASILINATPVGMYPNDSQPLLIDEALLHSDLLVCDLVYNPPETALLRAAKRAGARILNGVGMLAYQGGISLQLWTGQEPPFELMKEMLVRILD